MTGDWVATYPEETKAIQAAGHDLGSLGESGQDMTQLDKDGKTVELTDVHTKVKELTGVEMELFRPPLGAYDNEVLRTANAVGYYIVQWSVDSMDWKDYGADVIAETVCSHKDLGNGAIIRCHNGAKYTAQALDGMLDGLKSQGYEIVPVSHLIYRSDFHIDQTGDRCWTDDPIAYLEALLRSLESRIFLRMRRLEGVISSSSSVLMNSNACSRLRILGGVSLRASSAEEERVLVRCLVLQTFNSISSAFPFWPMTMPL